MPNPAYDAALARLKTAVTENRTVDGSAKELLAKLAGIIRDSKNDPAALEALAADLESDNVSLAEAVAANTPAEEPPAPTP